MKAKPLPVDELPEHDFKVLFGAGTGSGTFAHFAGIGGGLVYIPILNTGLKYPIRRTISISLKTMVVGSLVGAISFIILGSTIQESDWPLLSFGFFNLICFIALAISSIPMARVGARYSKKTDPKHLKPLLASLYIFIGFWILLTSFGIIPLTPQ